jgi:hypothetical protein
MARKDRTAMFIDRLHGEISSLQNPTDCTLARLLLVDYEAEALRSVEAYLIRLSSALAEAYFSNRTLLLGPTPFFPNQPIRACGASGSLHECFFLPLSSCSIDDLREEELYQLSVGCTIGSITHRTHVQRVKEHQRSRRAAFRIRRRLTRQVVRATTSASRIVRCGRRYPWAADFRRSLSARRVPGHSL